MAVLSSSPLRAWAAPQKNWTRYHAFDNQLQFSYPLDLLSVTADSNGVTLSHSVPFRHPNPCDFEGDSQDLDRFLDFSVSLKLENRPMMEAIKNRFAYAVVPRRTKLDVYGADSLIDEIEWGKIGAWSGNRVHWSVESCGSQVYFFAAGNRTLVAERSVISLFQTTWIDTVRTLPGVITPEREEELFADIIRSASMVMPATARPPARDQAALHLDHKAPSPPVATVRHIWRGFGMWSTGGDGWIDASNSSSGGASLDIQGAVDDRTPVDSLRYRIRYVGGDLPYGMILDCNTAAPMLWTRPRLFDIRWSDGKTWTQEPFSFRVSLTAVDLVGNESKPSKPIVIEEDGYAAERKRQLQESDGRVITRTQDGIEDRDFQRLSMFGKSRVPSPTLTVEEYPLPDGQVPNSRFQDRYANTFMGEVQADLSAWHPEEPKVHAPLCPPGMKQSFKIAGTGYHFTVTTMKRNVARLDVCQGDTVIYSVNARHVASQTPAITFYAWDDRGTAHWILEYHDHVVVDGKDLNEYHNYQRSFFYRIVGGKPFYFAEVYDKVRVCWGVKIADQNYDEVIYAPDSFSSEWNPRHYESVVAFYARRGRQWNYVLAGPK